MGRIWQTPNRGRFWHSPGGVREGRLRFRSCAYLASVRACHSTVFAYHAMGRVRRPPTWVGVWQPPTGVGFGKKYW